MKWSLALGLLLLVAPIHARDFAPDPQLAPDWDGRCDGHVGCASGEVLGYVTAANWASEIQVSFQLPEPGHGGPWMVEYVALYLGGSGVHEVILREAADLTSTPGDIVAESISFNPIHAAWPPSDWTYVPLKTGARCPAYLLAAGGDCFTIGIALTPTTQLGVSPAESETSGWGYHGGAWNSDEVVPAVRIGIVDLGLSQANKTTWGAIKDLFQ